LREKINDKIDDVKENLKDRVIDAVKEKIGLKKEEEPEKKEESGEKPSLMERASDLIGDKIHDLKRTLNGKEHAAPSDDDKREMLKGKKADAESEKKEEEGFFGRISHAFDGLFGGSDEKKDRDIEHISKEDFAEEIKHTFGKDKKKVAEKFNKMNDDLEHLEEKAQ